jgi:hypothetical protein
MKPPESKNGGPASEAAARMITPVAKPKADVVGAGVNVVQIGRWLDDAIAMCRRAASDPVEFQRLGIWLQRMRRAIS